MNGTMEWLTGSTVWTAGRPLRRSAGYRALIRWLGLLLAASALMANLGMAHAAGEPARLAPAMMDQANRASDQTIRVIISRTVGAADMVETPGQGDDAVTAWSGYGTTQDGFSKPDLVAPGRAITLVLAPGSVFGQQNTADVVDDHYLTLSGTSMSSAVVAGVAALIFQAQPSWTTSSWTMSSWTTSTTP